MLIFSPTTKTIYIFLALAFAERKISRFLTFKAHWTTWLQINVNDSLKIKSPLPSLSLVSRGSIVVQIGKSQVLFPPVSLEFSINNPSGRTIALESTQSLTEMNTRNTSLGQVVLTTLSHSCVDCLEIWEPQLSGTLRACPGFTYPLHYDEETWR
jgi:hypothetical protein